MNPTSIQETKSFSSIANHFISNRHPRMPLPETIAITSASRHRPWDNGESRAVGLGIVGALRSGTPDKRSCKPDSRMVLFGSQLKIQVPSIHPNAIEFSHSPIEFGVKSKNSLLALLSPAQRAQMVSANLGSDVWPSSAQVFTGTLPPSEMELSEDYTCVISHGPNPRTTHIFDNCIVKSCGDGFTPPRKENGFAPLRKENGSDDFLTSCYACKKILGQGKDIFIYRGEKAFCSNECRYQEMIFDEGMEKTSLDPLATL